VAAWHFRISEEEKSREILSVLDLRTLHRYANIRRLSGSIRRKFMQGGKGFVVIAAVVAAVTVGACRREVPHEPMKLGADVPAQTQVAR